MSELPPRIRSLLFVPGGRPDMIAKVVRYGPDAAVIDLEDAVPAHDKDRARAAAVRAIGTLDPPPATTVLIRINPPGTPWFADDLAAAAGTAAGVVLPKLERREQLDQVRAGLGRVDCLVIGGIETALGVADARALLTAGPAAVYFGAEDFIADLGGRRTPDGTEVLYARSQVALAARLAGIPAIDQAVVDIADEARFRVDAQAGAALGYQGKICVHPRQVEAANKAFTPSAAELAHARAVLAAGRGGVGVVAGQMIDRVHSRMAETVLRRAGER